MPVKYLGKVGYRICFGSKAKNPGRAGGRLFTILNLIRFRTSTVMSAGAKKAFQFRVLVTDPGIFNCHGLRFQFSAPDEDHPDEDELIPLEVAFVACQK